MMCNVFENLLEYDPTSFATQPALAESYDVSDDGMTYTFHLRDGVKFHDGTPMDAEAVQFSYQRIMDPDNEYYKMGQPFPLIDFWYEAIDPKKIDVKDELDGRLQPQETAFDPRRLPGLAGGGHRQPDGAEGVRRRLPQPPGRHRSLRLQGVGPQPAARVRPLRRLLERTRRARRRHLPADHRRADPRHRAAGRQHRLRLRPAAGQRRPDQDVTRRARSTRPRSVTSGSWS